MKLSPAISAAGTGHGMVRGMPIDFVKLLEATREEGAWPLPAEPGYPIRDVAAGLRKWDPISRSWPPVSIAHARSGRLA